MFERRRGRSGIIIALFGLLVVSAGAEAFETFPIAREPGHQQFPAIDDYTVVWQTNRNGDWDIGLGDISYPGSIDPLTLADTLSEAQYPAVSGIDTMIFYDGWSTAVGEKTYEYAGVDPGKAYLIEGQKFFRELVKHDLLVDAGNADLSRLVEELVVARARRGVVASPANAVEEITLP